MNLSVHVLFLYQFHNSVFISRTKKKCKQTNKVEFLPPPLQFTAMGRNNRQKGGGGRGEYKSAIFRFLPPFPCAVFRRRSDKISEL